ncbi:MAG: RNA-binding S4 domain-containing protein [Lachnospiraceae bacterium]|nr:RNA-binding S4 domain-containing protein [Lachnospiraceae bacterium]
MDIVKIKDENIKLGQLLKLSGLVDSGLEAKIVINQGKVKVNEEIIVQRGKKIFPGDIVIYDNKTIKVEN